MGKGRDKQKKRDRVNPQKQARKQERQVHKEQKHLLRQQKKGGTEDGMDVEEDITVTVERIRVRHTSSAVQSKDGPHLVEVSIPHPSERMNGTLVPHPGRDSATHLLLFGGEYWNGTKTFTYGELYRFGIARSEWHHIELEGAVQPPPRSSHQAVCFSKYMFVFGGEFTSLSQSQFYHYCDTWRLSVTDEGSTHHRTRMYTWEEVARSGVRPPPRSGHRMCLVPKHRSIFLFGGFFDTNGESISYYNDAWVLDNLDSGPRWRCLQEATTQGTVPAPRSGHCMAVQEDSVLIYGGFCSSHGEAQTPHVYTDLWEYNCSTSVWRPLKKSGIAPTIRSGMTMVQRGNRAYIFGGVFDSGDEHEGRWRSRFFNDLYLLNTETRRFFPLPLRKKNESNERSKHSAGAQQAAPALSLAEELAAIVPRLSLHEEDEVAEVSEIIEAKYTENQVAPVAREEDAVEPRYTHLEILPGVTVPCPRFGAMMCVVGHTLYLMGGQMEEGDREITFHDMYALNLNHMHTYEVLLTMDITRQAWYHEDQDWETLCSMASGAIGGTTTKDDDSSSDSDDTSKSSISSVPEISDTEDTEDASQIPELVNATDAPPDTTASSPTGLTANALSLHSCTTGAKHRGARGNAAAHAGGGTLSDVARARLALLMNEVKNEDNELPIPKEGEKCAAFFARTKSFWTQYIKDLSQESGCLLSGSGESFARQRWEDYQPIIEQIESLKMDIKRSSRTSGGSKK